MRLAVSFVVCLTLLVAASAAASLLMVDGHTLQQFVVPASSVTTQYSIASPLKACAGPCSSLDAPTIEDAYFHHSQPTITLTWTVVGGASGYRVYRGEKGDDDLSLLAEVKETRFDDTSIEEDKTYVYAVTAVDPGGFESARSGESSVEASLPETATPTATAGAEESAVESQTTALRTRPDPTATPSPTPTPGQGPDQLTGEFLPDTPAIKLHWQPSAGASSYKVYVSTSENGTYRLAGTSIGGTYFDERIEAGKTYYYAVAAIGADGRESYRSDPISVDAFLPTPTITATPKATATPSATATPTATAVPPTATSTPTQTPTPTPSPTPDDG